MWDDGIITVGNVKVSYQVKHCAEGGDFGINGGKISKMAMWLSGTRADGKGIRHTNIADVYDQRNIVAHYEREWDIAPDEGNNAVMAAYREILKIYN